MKKIQILGGGCKNCSVLYDNAKAAAEKNGIEYSIEKISDFKMIAALGVMTTPALMIDGQVKSAGKVLSVDEISGLLQ